MAKTIQHCEIDDCTLTARKYGLCVKHLAAARDGEQPARGVLVEHMKHPDPGETTMAETTDKTCNVAASKTPRTKGRPAKGRTPPSSATSDTAAELPRSMVTGATLQELLRSLGVAAVRIADGSTVLINQTTAQAARVRLDGTWTELKEAWTHMTNGRL